MPPALDRSWRSRVDVDQEEKPMNVANLQLEGLMMAVAALNHVLVRKGILSVAEVDTALLKAQSNMTGEDRTSELSPASRDAINFPLRVLQICNQCNPEADLPMFSEITRLVADLKPPYNDQL
jgi:hypothetical protein